MIYLDDPLKRLFKAICLFIQLTLKHLNEWKDRMFDKKKLFKQSINNINNDYLYIIIIKIQICFIVSKLNIFILKSINIINQQIKYINIKN